MSRLVKFLVIPVVAAAGLLFTSAPEAKAGGWGLSFYGGSPNIGYYGSPYGGYSNGYGGYGGGYGNYGSYNTFYGTGGYFPYNSFRSSYYGGGSPYYGGSHHHHCR